MNNKGFIKHYYIMLIPGMIWLLIFSIVPMTGILIAFERFNPSKGIFNSTWIGLQNFQYMFQLSDVRGVFINTLFIAFMKIIGNIIVPLFFFLLLNELALIRLKKFMQTIIYLPHFLSWVVLAGIILDIFSYNGPVNAFRSIFGANPVLFFGKPNLFPWIVIGTDLWKEYGFNAIIYLSALTSISPELYEAATIDGASRFRRLLHVTLPGLLPTIILLVVLGLSNILNANFDQIYNLYNPIVYSSGDIIDTWVFRMGLFNLQYSMSTAVGLLKSVVSSILILLAYLFAYKFTNYRIF